MQRIYFFKLSKLLKLFSRNFSWLYSSLLKIYSLSEFTILENLSCNLNKFTSNISDTQNFTYFCSLNLAWTHVYFISLLFSLPTLVTHIQYETSFAVRSPLQFHSFIFISLLRLTPVHVETQYGSPTSQNSIENHIREYIRVYSIGRNKVNNQRQPKNRGEF